MKEEIKKYLRCLMATILGIAMLVFALWVILFVPTKFGLTGFFIIWVLLVSIWVYLQS